AGLLRPFAVRREKKRLGEIDALVCIVLRGTETAAAAAATPATAAWPVETDEPELDLLRVADSAGQIHRPSAVERNTIDVEPVVEQHRLSILRPAGNAIERFLVRMVISLVDETDLVAAAEQRRAAGVEVVSVELLVLEVEEPLAVGRRAHGAHELRVDQRAVGGLGIDAVVVGVSAAPCDFATIGRVDAADRPTRIRGRRDGAHRLVGDARQLARRQVEYRG